MNFLHITTFYPPYSFGGDASYVARLCALLAGRGHHVEVIHSVDSFRALHRGPLPEPPPQTPGVRVHSLRSRLGAPAPLLSQQTGRPLLQRRRIRGILDSRRWDAIHFHNVSLFGPGVLEMEPAQGEPVKIYSAHENWLICPTHMLWRYDGHPCPAPQCLRCTLHARRPPQWWRYTGLRDRAAASVDLFLTAGEYWARKHAERGFPFPLEPLPLFADVPDLAALDRAGPAHPRPYFLFAGRLEFVKGLQDVLRFWRRCEVADLLVAGDGNYRDERKPYAPWRGIGRRGPSAAGGAERPISAAGLRRCT